MTSVVERLKTQLAEAPPDFSDGISLLTLLYEDYNEVNPMDDRAIKADFNELY